MSDPISLILLNCNFQSHLIHYSPSFLGKQNNHSYIYNKIEIINCDNFLRAVRENVEKMKHDNQ